MPHHERYYQPQDCSPRGGCQPQQNFDGGAVYNDMRLQRCNNGRCSTGGDQGGQFETLNSQQYEAKTEGTFSKEHKITDSGNYRENLWTAAEQQKPIVMVFGRGGDPNNGAVLDAVARAKEKANGSAEFMYVDLNKVDPNSPIGKYARDYIGTQYGTPLTMVFTQKQGEGKTPVIPERPLHWQRGGYIDENALSAGISQAVEIQKGREIKTGREKKPDVPPESDTTPPADKPKPKTPQDVVAESVKPWKEQKVEELFKGMSPEQRATMCKDAIELADKQGNSKLSAQVRAMVGLASIGWGAEADKAGNKDLAERHFLRGSEYIMSAGVYNPEIYKYPGFQAALKESKLPGNAANFLIDKGLADANRPADQKPWFFPNAAEAAKPNGYQDKRDWYYNQIRQEMKKQPAGVRR
jgi:hypothetical protein